VKGDYLNVYLDVTAVPGTTIIPEFVPDDEPAARAGGGAPLPLPSVTGTGGGTP
jgi:phospholipid/cholesterol/gamma-HCH transport system substrate-binding protein